MQYGYIGSMRAKSGHRDHVVSILLSDVDGLRAAGCTIYIVSRAADDEDIIWVNEVWQSKQHHDESLQLPATKDAIARAMPMLTGEFTGQELRVAGGLGLQPTA